MACLLQWALWWLLFFVTAVDTTLSSPDASVIARTDGRVSSDLDGGCDEATLMQVQLLQTKLSLGTSRGTSGVQAAQLAEVALLPHQTNGHKATGWSLLVELGSAATVGIRQVVTLLDPEHLQERIYSVLQSEPPDDFAPVRRLKLEWVVLGAYLALYLSSIAVMGRSMTVSSQPSGKDSLQRQQDWEGRKHEHEGEFTEIDVEEETWRVSFIRWLSVAWASPWVARWGHSLNSALTKIKADELPQLGGRQLQAQNCAERFEQLWAEEVAKNGLAKAQIANVLPRLLPRLKMIQLMFCNGFQIMLGQLYSVFLIQTSLVFYFRLQTRDQLYPDEDRDMTVPLLLAVVAFSALPFSNVVLSSTTNSICCQLDQLLCGGLAVTLFRKAQRLPANSSSQQEPQGEFLAGGADAPRVDLTALINYDVLQSLQGAFLQFCFCCSAWCSLCILTVLMSIQLRVATLCAFGVAVPAVLIVLVLGETFSKALQELQERTDRRVAAVREVLFGVRVVKCYGWEEAIGHRIGALRRAEVQSLGRYFRFCGILAGLFTSFPRLLILAGLWGYSAIYGTHDVATIFTSLQILACLRASCELFAQSMSRAGAIAPCLGRVEFFLKLPEAPTLASHEPPAWLKLWPEPPVAELLLKAPSAGPLLVHGTFRWSPDGKIALSEVDLQVPEGQLVAVVGSVGSGKTALLMAALGELYPSVELGDVEVGRPAVVAYCSQVPHIAEGTLRENVLFGQPLEEARYNEALEASGLAPDLKMLPGGDCVQIGSRGIALSGGQRARVAMARAAYHRTPLVLIDDAFGSVDAPTASHILERLLMGPLLRGRTLLVALQPETERLKLFDRVVLMSGGRILMNGTPEDVITSEGFQKLLSGTQRSFGGPKLKVNSAEFSYDETSSTRLSRLQLREEEFEGRPTLAMVQQYCGVGRWRNIATALIIFCLVIYFFLLCDLVLAQWANVIALNPSINPEPFLWGYLFWLTVGTMMFGVSWVSGEWFTERISMDIHRMVFSRLLRAPVDRFFDKHPVGRIMNRLAADLASIDRFLFTKSVSTVVILYSTLIPLAYVHAMLPWIITLISPPFYYLVYCFYARYRNTNVPLRYCMASTASEMNGLIVDVSNSSVVIRAFRQQDRVSRELGRAVNRLLKVNMISERVMRRWLVNRIIYLWSFICTTVYLVALMMPSLLGAGTLGLCLTSLLLMESLIEPNVEGAIGSLFELIALARVHEYLGTPQEAPRRRFVDSKYVSFSVNIARNELTGLVCNSLDGEVKVIRNGALVLRSSANGKALVAASWTTCGANAGPLPTLAVLCPSSKQLAAAHVGHHIVAVNDVIGNAQQMAFELCGPEGEDKGPALLRLDVRSSWLDGGAMVEFESVRAGYADNPFDVLNGVSFSVQACTKVGIVGSTGCGKSTLLLVLLRILEPRTGRILINGVNIQELGLATLRQTLGLVPQDPLLFSGTLRHNLDPSGTLSDRRLWHALRLVKLQDLVESWPLKLDHQVCGLDEGAVISFGQRQQLCLARMVLRQPSLLLLDEATSAIDPRTQEHLQETISAAFPHATLIAVAHRLETLLDYDRVVVLDRGTVVEEGSVKELANRKDGRLQRMLSAKETW